MLTTSKGTAGSNSAQDEEKTDEVCVSQSVIDACQDPLIGLQYITEFQQKPNTSSTLCVCNLCEVKFSFKLIASHATAMKHRLHYMKERFMNYHTMIYQQARNNADKTELSIEYAKCIEEEEGRQKVKVKVINAAAVETKSTSSGVKRPAECEDIPNPVPSKVRKVTDVRDSVVAKQTSSSVTNKPVIPMAPTSLHVRPLMAGVARTTRPLGLTFIGRSPLAVSLPSPLSNFRPPRPSPLRSALRIITPGMPTRNSSPSQMLSSKVLHEPKITRINFVGKNTSVKDTLASNSDVLHTNQHSSNLTPSSIYSSSSPVENSDRELRQKSSLYGARWNSSALPKKSSLRSSNLPNTSPVSKKSCLKSSKTLLSSTSEQTVEISPGACSSNHSLYSTDVVDVKFETPEDVTLEDCLPMSSYPESLDVNVLKISPPSTPPPLPPALSPPSLVKPPAQTTLPHLQPALPPPSLALQPLRQSLPPLQPALPPPSLALRPLQTSLPPLKPSFPSLPPALPPARPPSPFPPSTPPASEGGSSELEESPTSRSTLHLHPGFAKLLELFGSPGKSSADDNKLSPTNQKPSPARQSSVAQGLSPAYQSASPGQSSSASSVSLRPSPACQSSVRQRPPPVSKSPLPNVVHTNLLYDVGLKLLKHVSSRPRPQHPVPSSGPCPPPSGTLPTTQHQSHPRPPPPPPPSSIVQHSQIQHNVQSGLKFARPTHISTGPNSQLLHPPVFGQDVRSANSSGRPVASHVIPQSNANLLQGTMRPVSDNAVPQLNVIFSRGTLRPVSDHTISQSNVNLPRVTMNPVSNHSIPQPNTSLSHGTMRPISDPSIPQFSTYRSIYSIQSTVSSGTPQSSGSSIHSSTGNLNARFSRAPHSSPANTTWSSIRPQSEGFSNQINTNPTQINLIRFPLPTKQNLDPIQFPPVYETGLIPPSYGANSGVHPRNHASLPSGNIRLPHVSMSQMQHIPNYGQSYQTRFTGEMPPFVSDGKTTNGSLKDYSKEAGTSLFSVVLTDPRRKSTEIPVGPPRPNSTVSAVNSPPGGMRSVQSAQSVVSLPPRLSHANSFTSTFSKNVASNASAMSNALARALVDYKLMQKDDKKAE